MNLLKQISRFLSLALASVPIAFAATKSMQVELKNTEGKNVGTATLTELKQGVKIELHARDLTPGEHAFHIHEKGECKGPDFKSAGDHYAPQKHKHGFDVSNGPHAGDMPNIIVGQDGVGLAEMINTNVTLSKGPKSLLKEGGTALVIHAKSDDYKTQPAGDAGDRVVCAEIRR